MKDERGPLGKHSVFPGKERRLFKMLSVDTLGDEPGKLPEAKPRSPQSKLELSSVANGKPQWACLEGKDIIRFVF